MSGLSDSHHFDEGTSLTIFDGSGGHWNESPINQTMSDGGASGGTQMSGQFYEPDDIDMARMMWSLAKTVIDGEQNDNFEEGTSLEMKSVAVSRVLP